MRYLVIGGAGFIGSHVVEALSVRGDDVTVLDNRSTGDQANLVAVGETARFVYGSVLDPLVVDELTELVRMTGSGTESASR